MAQSSIGKKHICPTCHARFFDLGKNNVMCPKCGANTDESVENTTVLEALTPDPDIENTPIPAKPTDTEDDLLDIDVDIDDDDEDDDDDSLMEDTSDLGNVDDDVSEILEHVESPNPIET